MYFDSHVHVAGMETAAMVAMLDRAVVAGVGRCLLVGGGEELNAGALLAARSHAAVAGVALGFDRGHARLLASGGMGLDALMGELEGLLSAASPGVVRAVGEIGLDYHYEPETASLQEALFVAQLAVACSRRLPVVIHSREADAATLEALAAHARAWTGDPERLGVLHCFTGSEAFARRLVELGYSLSFSGIVTFRNAEALRRVAAWTPEHRLLIETDAPYLAPVPLRGQPNEPAYLVHVAAAVAAVRGVAVEDLAAVTTRNAGRLFGVESATLPAG